MKDKHEHLITIENIGFLLGKSSAIKDRLLEKHLLNANLEEEITGCQAKVLFQIYKFESYRHAEIGKMLNVDKSNITRMVDRLEKKDLLQRKVDPDDRRSSLLFLTAKGKALVQQCLPLAEQAFTELEQGLTETEKVQLHSILKKIITSSLNEQD